MAGAALGMLWLLRRQAARLGAGAVRRRIAWTLVVHGGAHSSHHLRRRDGLAALRVGGFGGLALDEKMARAGADRGGGGDGGAVRRAAARPLFRRGGRRLRAAALALVGAARPGAGRGGAGRRRGGAHRVRACSCPLLAHVPLSPRHLSTDYHFAASYAWPELKYALLLVAPDFLGTEEKGAWFGAYNYWEMAGYYAGFFGQLYSRAAGLWRRRPELWALAGGGAARGGARVRREDAAARAVLSLRAALRDAALPDARAGDAVVRGRGAGRGGAAAPVGEKFSAALGGARVRHFVAPVRGGDG